MRMLLVLGLVLAGCSGLSDKEVAEYSERCRETDACREFGRCTWNKLVDVEPWKQKYCIPASVHDCQSSELCAKSGMCGLDKLCTTTEEGCMASELCKRVGACHKHESSCRPLSDDDCRNSDMCRNAGACRLDGSTCGT